MADDKEASNEIGDDVEQTDGNDYEDLDGTSSTTTTTIITPVVETDDVVPSIVDEDEEPIEDYVVNLVVNEAPDTETATDLINAAITDINGNLIPSRTSQIIDTFNNYSTQLIDEVTASTTAIGSEKKWWGWSTRSWIIIGLIALTILGLIVACLFFVIGKKFRKNQRTTSAGTTATTKAVVTKGISPDQKYQQVPNV